LSAIDQVLDIPTFPMTPEAIKWTKEFCRRLGYDEKKTLDPLSDSMRGLEIR
jgi:hypothetical protein